MITSSLTLVLLVVVISNTITVVQLLKTKGRQDERIQENRKATITVLILAVLFCLFNTLFVVRKWYAIPSGMLYDPNNRKELLKMIAHFIAIPLNSALNPAVYFIRKQAMRTYVINLCCCIRNLMTGFCGGLWRKVIRCLRKEVEPDHPRECEYSELELSQTFVTAF